MNYIRALIISCLLHSLAFAAYILINQFFAARKASSVPNSIQGTALTVNLVEDSFVVSKISSKEDASPSIKKERKVEQLTAVNATEKTAVSVPLSRAQNLVEKTNFEQNEKGGANLTPSPTNQLPRYPETARKEGLEGNMILELTVNEKGCVDQIKVIKETDNPAPEILQEAAIDAVKPWRFVHIKTPRTPVTIQVPITFSLED